MFSDDESWHVWRGNDDEAIRDHNPNVTQITYMCKILMSPINIYMLILHARVFHSVTFMHLRQKGQTKNFSLMETAPK